MPSVMILEDDQNLPAGIKLALAGDDIDFALIETIKDARDALINTKFDLLIIDILALILLMEADCSFVRI